MNQNSRLVLCATVLWGVGLLVSACGGRPTTTLSTQALPPVDHIDPTTAVREVWQGRRPVRIGLRVGVDAIALQSARACVLRDGAGRSLAQWPSSVSLEFRPVSGGIEWRRQGDGPWRRGPSRLRLERSEGQLWTLDGDRYAGSLVVRKEGSTGLTLVEEVGLERYLEGVVPWEIGRPEGEAFTAVQAQAIAARTYAYAHLGHWEAEGFDLRADVGDQVYRGRSGSSEITDRAVRTTAGRVLAFEGRLIRAYYSSTCGGYSSDLVDVWQKEGAPYLVGGLDRWRGRTACAASPHFRWTESWSARELGEILRQELPQLVGQSLDPREIGVLEGLEVLDRDRSGRVQRLGILTDRGHFEVWGDRIRWALRPARGRFSILRSTLFDIIEHRRDGKLVGVELHGGGFGHGVGLCQTGALQRARWGQSAEEILAHYYRGASVVSVDDLQPTAVVLR